MPIGWHIFRIICLLQMLAGCFFTFSCFIGFFNYPNVIDFLQAIAFGFITSFAVFALNLLNRNYPDKPVAGKQKTAFNWLFLINFLLLAFLFGWFFSAYQVLQTVATLTGKGIFAVPFRVWLPALVFTAMLLFQFILLYGLYILRRLLYLNFFDQQQFEFENSKE
ncbi:MAG TPA: hypothetical protein VF476_15820 [Chitinophagaceae bacterium]